MVGPDSIRLPGHDTFRDSDARSGKQAGGMEHLDEINRQASDACYSRVWTNTVAIVNTIRTIGRDPVTNRPADGEEAGTGCAGRWGGHHFVLTAGHVLHPNAHPSDLRIFWRPTGRVERISDADLKPEDIVEAVPIRDPDAVIRQCSWEDLAIIELDQSEAGPYSEFVDIGNDWVDPVDGEMVHCCGFPVDKTIVVGSRMVGSKEERDMALRPTVVSGRVFRCLTS